MTDLVPESSPSIDPEQRSRSLRALFLSAMMTFFVLVPEEIRNVVSVDATLAAVTIGGVAGIAVSVALARFQIQVRNDVRTTVVAFVSTGVAAVLLWILLPTELLQVVPHFGLAVLWSFALVSVARDVVWPTAIESTVT